MSIYKGETPLTGTWPQYFARTPNWDAAEDVTIAQFQAGYTTPSDGMFMGQISYDAYTQGTSLQITINGVGYYRAQNRLQDVGQRSLPLSIPLNKGDIVQLDSGTASIGPGLRFVPYEDTVISGVEEITKQVIRDMFTPDWANAVSVNRATLYSGYTCPSRGLFFYSGDNSAQGNQTISVNGVVISYAHHYSANDHEVQANIEVPVNQGDIVKTSSLPSDYDYIGKFVPYKVQ